MTTHSRSSVLIAIALCVAAASVAHAQQEFPPPKGKGHVVVMGSGVGGPEIVASVARDVAELGYDVVLYDGNAWEGTHGDGLKAAIDQSQQMPHALPGKVALIGFSAGGGIDLYYGVQWPDQVVGAVLWYPATKFISDVPGFISRLTMPILAFGGGVDHFKDDCCTAAGDQAVADAAKKAGKPFEFVLYPDADHDFVKGAPHYNARDYDDSLQRAAAQLKIYFSRN